MHLSSYLVAAASSFIFSASANPVPEDTAVIGTGCEIVGNVTVIAGDGLFNIATDNNVTLAQVLYVNPDITNARFIDVGDIILIPAGTCVAPAVEEPVEPTATCTNGTATTYTVVSQDTLTIIAKEKLGITLEALVNANPQITNIDSINIGDIIFVPVCATPTTTTTGVPLETHYTGFNGGKKARQKMAAQAFMNNGKTDYNGTRGRKDCDDIDAIIIILV